MIQSKTLLRFLAFIALPIILFAGTVQVVITLGGDVTGAQNATVVGHVTGSQTVVSFSATPTFNAATANGFKITLTGNVTSSTLSGASAGTPIYFQICQDGSGSHTFVWPANMLGTMTIGSTASKCSAQSFLYDGSNAYALSTGVTNQ